MIEIIQDLPENVIGFHATGKVNKEDYEKILIPAVDTQAKKFNKINFLLWVDTDVSNYTFGAWVDDALVGLKHLTHWHKVAIVSSSDTIKKIINIRSKADSSEKYSLNYFENGNNILFRGKWKQDSIEVLMRKYDLNSYLLHREKFTWITQ